MSDSLSPASAIAFNAASAWSWICDMLGMTPSSVVSAAPTMAIWFLRIASILRRAEQGKSDVLVELLELDLDLHVELKCLWRLRAIDDVGHHPRAFVELDHSDRIGRGEAGGGAVMDDVAVELALAARLEARDRARGAARAERAWREIDMRAGITALQAQLARFCAVPEMLGFGRRLRFRARRLGHVGVSL